MSTRPQGFTLVEVMIVVAILSLVAAIAIPAYNGYIREAKLGVARQNMESLRFFLEDYGLENSTYMVNGNASYGASVLANTIGWSPDGDQGKYTYTVKDASATSYSIVAEYTGGTPWLRCENRMNNCCDDKSGGSTAACP